MDLLLHHAWCPDGCPRAAACHSSVTQHLLYSCPVLGTETGGGQACHTVPKLKSISTAVILCANYHIKPTRPPLASAPLGQPTSSLATS